MKQFIELTQVSNPPAAGSAVQTVVKLVGGYRYHNIPISGVAGAAQTMSAGFGKIQLKYGTRLQREVDPVNMDKIAKVYGARFGIQNDVNAGPFQLPVFFTEDWREQYGAKEGTALDVLEGEDVSLVVHSKAAATAPALSFLADVEDLNEIRAKQKRLNRVIINGQNLPTLVKWYEDSKPIAGTVLTVSDLIEKKDVLTHLRLGQTTDAKTVEKVRIMADGQIWFERTRTQNNALLTRLGMTPEANVFDIVPDAYDNPDDAWILSGLRKLEIQLTMSAATNGSLPFVCCKFGAPE